MDPSGSAPRSSFDIEGNRELRAVSRLMQRSVEADTVFEGRDSSGLITVLVNGRGLVQDVTVDGGWVNAVGPSALGDALLQAFQAANIEALAASLQNFRAAVDSGGVAEQVVEVAEEEAAPEGRKSYEDLVRELEEANASLDRTVAKVEEYNRRTGVSGKANLLRLNLDQGSMTSITVTDPRRATQMSAFQLATEALSMFQAAAPPSF
jgi:DNA-binding protein YbaB